MTNSKRFEGTTKLFGKLSYANNLLIKAKFSSNELDWAETVLRMENGLTLQEVREIGIPLWSVKNSGPVFLDTTRKGCVRGEVYSFVEAGPDLAEALKRATAKTRKIKEWYWRSLSGRIDRLARKIRRAAWAAKSKLSLTPTHSELLETGEEA